MSHLRPFQHICKNLIALIFLCSVGTQPTVAADRSLLISIGDYRADPAIHPLAGPQQDAAAIQQLLTQRLGYKPENVLRLNDAEANTAAVRTAVAEFLIKGTAPGDRVFLYFSGHGAQTPDLNNDEKDGLDEVLITYDTTLDKTNRRLNNAILDDEVEDWLKQLNGRIVTVVVDSCHSGTVSRSISEGTQSNNTRTPGGFHILFPPGKSRSLVVEEHRQETTLLEAKDQVAVWTAVSAYQEALDDVETNPITGHFTNRFIRGVTTKSADANRDGQISHAELLDWLRLESESYCKRNARICKTGLTPTLEIEASLMPQPIETSLLGQGNIEQSAIDIASAGLASGNHSQWSASDETKAVKLSIRTSQGNCQQDFCNLSKGQNVKFQVESPLSGYLTLLNIDPKGQLVQIYPNNLSVRKNKEGRIKSDQSIIVPDSYYGFDFSVQPPLGRGQLIAVVTDQKVDFSDILDLKRSLSVIDESSSKDVLSKIIHKLRQPWTGDEFNRAVNWKIGNIKYQSNEPF